jgi:WD40 repeat protein/predicted Ser/Thr protein kinase
VSEPPGDRVQNLFDQAVMLPAEQRAAFLETACAGDPALRAEVQSLLVCDADFTEVAGDDGMLKSPIVRAPKPAASEAGELSVTSSPSRVGHYRIVRCIAEGGMGAVYEAEQDSPRRTVALKVIRPGLASPALIKRFRHEAQILGRLHHPGIAQVYEAGLADDGQPFFAMEFIRGLPLDEYARLQALAPPDRLALVVRVCDAVQHAHDQGVIHRDLKPANILVDESGQSKVLDFGVARATDVDLLTGAGLTRTGQLLGTPNYMSPEQVTADPAAIDQRADVYALGVILFELLTHRLPYQLDNRPLAEVARLIQEEKPPRLGSINPELRGDVETIVATALAKDPARRYRSAADLAADLRRWLAHEPIQARPPSALYQLRQFAQRHKALVGGVLATVLALVLGLVGTILFAVGEARQRRQADKEKHEAQFQAYRARVAAAVAALSVHDVADAANQLKESSQELRDWEWRHLHSRLDDSSAVVPWPGPETGLLPGAPDRLRAWALTSAGLVLADLESGGQKLLPIAAQRYGRISVAQTRRGLRLVAWVGKTSFDLLDEAGQQLCRVELPEAKEEPYQVVVSPDGMRLAVTAEDWKGQPLVVFDATSGKQMAVCAGHKAPTFALTFSPDGTRLASGSEDKTARLWDTASGELLATCRGHKSRIYSIAFRPDGACFVTASSDETVRQWDAAKGKELGAPYERHVGEVVLAVYSPDGEWVASTGIDRTVRVWQATLREDVAVLHGHAGPVVGLGFATGGRRLASFSSEATRWGKGDGTVRLWDADPEATLPVLRGHKRAIYPVALSPDGRWIASGDAGGEVRLWDAVTGEWCARLPHPGMVQSLAWSHDGTWLVTGSIADGRLRIWDAATARLPTEIIAPASDAYFVTVSPDGRRVAVTTTDSRSNKPRLHVGEIASDEWLFSAEGRALGYSPDGRWLAVRAPDERTVLLLDAGTHEIAARFDGHKDRVDSAAFSPDSRLLASCSLDRTVRVWQVGSGECRVLRGHTDDVFAAAFHPDSQRLATGGRDRAVWLWDLERDEEVARLRGHTSFVWALAFSRDGATLVSGSGDATVRLWVTTPVKDRYDARREAAALRPEAERLVEQLWRQKKNDPAAVVDALRADGALTEPLRHAALREVLRRAQSSTDVPGKPHDPP